MQRGDKGYWEWKKNVGRPKALRSVKQLIELAYGYFQWCDENPILKNELIKSGENAGAIIPVPIQRPYTWQGLEVYMTDKKVMAKLDDYRFNKEGRYAEFADAIAHITKIVHDQKYSFALVGAYNATLVSMELGMTQKTETTVIEQPLFPKDGK